MEKRLYVINSRGERELFSLKKVYNSCKGAGALPALAKQITQSIKKQIYPEIKTSEIFKLVKKLLSKESPSSQIRFSLKEAIRRLGPDGFDFEKYIAEIFLRGDFEVKINQRIPGKCISSYEIDFWARKEKLTYLGECKYHRFPGGRVDLKIALFNYARFSDILNGSYFKKDSEPKTIIVTNTKFTTEVIKYSKCMNIDLLGWSYPPKKGLESLVESLNLYPVTILPSFRGHFKRIFAERRMMLAIDLLESSPKNLAKKLNLPLRDLENLIKEAKMLLE